MLTYTWNWTEKKTWEASNFLVMASCIEVLFIPLLKVLSKGLCSLVLNLWFVSCPGFQLYKRFCGGSSTNSDATYLEGQNADVEEQKHCPQENGGFEGDESNNTDVKDKSTDKSTALWYCSSENQRLWTVGMSNNNCISDHSIWTLLWRHTALCRLYVHHTKPFGKVLAEQGCTNFFPGTVSI